MGCNGCHISILPGQHELCWYCLAYICGDCFEGVGHCGHSQADELNAMYRQGTTYQQLRIVGGTPLFVSKERKLCAPTASPTPSTQ